MSGLIWIQTVSYNLMLFQNVLKMTRLKSANDQKQFFPSDYGHVAYQIKGNDAYNNMQRNLSPYTHPRPPGMGSKVENFF